MCGNPRSRARPASARGRRGRCRPSMSACCVRLNATPDALRPGDEDVAPRILDAAVIARLLRHEVTSSRTPSSATGRRSRLSTTVTTAAGVDGRGTRYDRRTRAAPTGATSRHPVGWDGSSGLSRAAPVPLGRDEYEHTLGEPVQPSQREDRPARPRWVACAPHTCSRDPRAEDREVSN